MNIFRNVTLGFVLSGLVGCSMGSESPEGAPGASQGDESPPSSALEAQPRASLTDGQVAQAVASVNRAEIEQARVALTKAESPRVRDFASHMIEQHSRAQDRLANTTLEAGITGTASPTSYQLESMATEMLRKLRTVSGEDFDVIYMQGQIQQHQAALELLEQQLIPAADNAALRAQLQEVQAMVESHLESAREIQL